MMAFDTQITRIGGALIGPWRRPRQMLQAQTYDAHASIHDDATAQKLGFKGGTIEGPTHFSQFAPLCERQWGRAWFERGCLSVHYRSVCYEGEEVQATLLASSTEQPECQVQMLKRDGTEVLRGTASIVESPTALDIRLRELKPLADPVILRDVKVAQTSKRQTVRMAFDQNMGDLYPFSLRQKLAVITENSQYYSTADNPWGKPIIPMEMLSVLFQYRSKDDPLPAKGPAVGLFADQEIRLVKGPLFVDEEYEVEREVVALSGSRRTESAWVKTRVFAKAGTLVATMLLNMATLKDSYAPYEEEYRRLYGAGR
ncbi:MULTISPECIES: hypothetical protein [Bradyrhizobium]|uniref:N-terminal of MaoC-like dehydratase domain-containing protein n=1 Tax=Bradyrhizobium vignae TaxID=1549949 RepID=A0A2U3Q6F3_9BRAD|nr:hypothetical protein [Bradyrhizobium vignae]RXG92746.1 hypothetical protein EAV90_27060 [Bradyrhizobium vignae]SPP96889.1 conserved protein of unknown function [Bradyrhizobium vignae]